MKNPLPHPKKGLKELATVITLSGNMTSQVSGLGSKVDLEVKGQFLQCRVTNWHKS